MLMMNRVDLGDLCSFRTKAGRILPITFRVLPTRARKNLAYVSWIQTGPSEEYGRCERNGRSHSATGIFVWCLWCKIRGPNYTRRAKAHRSGNVHTAINRTASMRLPVSGPIVSEQRLPVSHHWQQFNRCPKASDTRGCHTFGKSRPHFRLASDMFARSRNRAKESR